MIPIVTLKKTDMKKKLQEIARDEMKGLKEKKISRKEAIKKTGYIVASATTMMLLLSNPNKAQAASPAPPPPWTIDFFA